MGWNFSPKVLEENLVTINKSVSRIEEKQGILLIYTGIGDGTISKY
jgi:hypothetical protein